jgi:HAD superfamily hydrolase (TIGR01662 family)
MVAEPDVGGCEDGVIAMNERVSSIRACSFDFGQTLAGLDVGLLVAKLSRLGIEMEPNPLEAAASTAWAAYDQAVRDGLGGHPWKLFMRTLLEVASSRSTLPRPRESEIERAVDALWEDQPRQNLWRRAVPEMIDLVRELRSMGIPCAIVSNSEGRLAELLEEIGLGELFPIVADSGRLGIEKPDRRIFEWAATQLGVEPKAVLHIGDSLGADVEGALAAGMQAVWFRSRELGMAPDSGATIVPGVSFCTSAADLRAYLVLHRVLPLPPRAPSR